MKIFLAGGTGFLGGSLLKALAYKADEIIVPSRRKREAHLQNVRFIHADLTQKGEWEKELAGCDVVINFAGYPVYRPWTAKVKRLIWETRVDLTRNLVEAFGGCEGKMLINASAVGIYGDQKEKTVTEETPSENENHFIVRLCRAWEEEALKASPKQKVAVLRMGIVTGRGSHFERALSAITRLKVAPILCSPNQWVSWIDVGDFVRAVEFILEKGGGGIYNMTSPNPLRQKEFFSKLFGTKIHPRIPCAFLKLLGEQGEFFTWSQRAIPQKLLNEGFEFSSYSNLCGQGAGGGGKEFEKLNAVS